MIAISRRGLTPRPHRESTTAPCEHRAPATRATASVRSLTRQLRIEIAQQEAQGRDWRDVIAALRPITPTLWQALDSDNRARFLRHLRPFWEVHRHRAAPAVARAIESAIASGTLTIRAARLERLSADGNALRADIRPRMGALAASESQESLRVGYAINCVGPSDELRAQPLLRSLLAAGEISQDRLRLGLLVDAQYRLVRTDGTPQPHLQYVGPLLKAQHWEATAVPELREHVANAARALIAAL